MSSGGFEMGESAQSVKKNGYDEVVAAVVDTIFFTGTDVVGGDNKK